MPTIHPTYLPFAADDLKEHLLADAEAHIGYFETSAQRALAAAERGPARTPQERRREPYDRQIEKDERFWTASSLMALAHSGDAPQAFRELVRRAFPSASADVVDAWLAAITDDVKLYFEVDLPSPASYRNHLREHIHERHLLPYAVERVVEGRTRGEGPTQVDGLVVDPGTGFAVIIEAKVLSDVSYQVSYDVFRNQIARNLDVLLERNERATSPVNLRDPGKTLFMLLTPRCFQDQPASRLYGHLMEEYRSDSSTLARDLPHRSPAELAGLRERIGWVTFEDIREICPGACAWLAPAAGMQDAQT